MVKWKRVAGALAVLTSGGLQMVEGRKCCSENVSDLQKRTQT